MREPTQNFPWLTVALLILVGGFWFLWRYILPNFDYATENISEEAFTVEGIIKPTVRKLDGVLVEKENANLAPVAVMIENHIDARPASALAKAQVVYEALSEYNITRFLAIYDLAANLEKIGPVRSARLYFIDLAEEYNAVYVHSGGSPDALDILKTQVGVYDLNEFFGYNTDYFRRDSNRYRPHNLYTSSAKLQKAIFDNNWPAEGDFVAWQFKNEAESALTSAEINIPYSESSTYNVIWRYDPANNIYKRWQNKQPHIDDSGETITAKNIVAQFVATAVIDDIGRRTMDLKSGGEAVIFQDGVTIAGRWEKRNGRTFFYDQSGEDIKFNRGPIWIEIVPDWLEVAY